MGDGVAALLAQHVLEGAMEGGGGYRDWQDDEAPLQKNGASGRENFGIGSDECWRISDSAERLFWASQKIGQEIGPLLERWFLIFLPKTYFWECFLDTLEDAVSSPYR